MFGPAQRERDRSIVGHGERAARVGPPEVEAANVRRDARDIALQRSEANAARAAVFVEEVNAAAVLEPGRGVNVSIELLGELPDATAVSIHDVEEIGLVALLLVVEANVGDVLAVGRDR